MAAFFDSCLLPELLMPPDLSRQDHRRLSSRQRGYDSRWERARLGFLRKHPLCVMCEREGLITPASVVDHIRPHRGDKALFWDQGNWQPLCKPHHDRDKQRIERGHEPQTLGDDGWPVS